MASHLEVPAYWTFTQEHFPRVKDSSMSTTFMMERASGLKQSWHYMCKWEKQGIDLLS